MISALRHWIAARRFHHHFIKPTEARLQACRSGHRKGAEAILRERKEAVHAALRGYTKGARA